MVLPAYTTRKGVDMKRFKSILAGVDLAQEDVLVSENLVPPTEEAVARALWLAKTNSARLFLFHVLPSWALNLDAETQMLLEKDLAKRTVKDHATEVLAKIAESNGSGCAVKLGTNAGKAGVRA